MIYIVNENEFKKKQRALRKYFMKTYKNYIFDVIDTLKRDGKKDGYYEVNLDTDKDFEKIYGSMKLKFNVKNDNVYLEDIEPSNLLLDLYTKILPTYRGIPYRDNRDLFKIKIVKGV